MLGLLGWGYWDRVIALEFGFGWYFFIFIFRLFQVVRVECNYINKCVHTHLSLSGLKLKLGLGLGLGLGPFSRRKSNTESTENGLYMKAKATNVRDLVTKPNIEL